MLQYFRCAQGIYRYEGTKTLIQYAWALEHVHYLSLSYVFFCYFRVFLLLFLFFLNALVLMFSHATSPVRCEEFHECAAMRESRECR